MSTNGVGKNVVIWFNPVEKTWLMVWSHIASPGHKTFFVLSDIFCRTSFVRMHACYGKFLYVVSIHAKFN